MEGKINIASWNLCLGLLNKKDYVSQMIISNKIDICCLQEIELKQDIGYSLLAESNYLKSRVGIYVKYGINYVRRADLELRNNGMIILDINMKSKYRLINLYRSFNPTDGSSQRDIYRRFSCCFPYKLQSSSPVSRQRQSDYYQ